MLLCHDDAFVVFDAQVVHDELAAFEGVLAHVEAEHTFGVEILVQQHGVEAHIFADEGLELVGRDLAETFESGNLGVGDGLEGVDAFLIGIAVSGFLFVAHAEQGGLQNIDMALLIRNNIQ